jgi:hypothetical protein
VDNAVTNEAKEAAVDQAVKDVAADAGATEKQIADAASGDSAATAASNANDAQKNAVTANSGDVASKQGVDAVEIRPGEAAAQAALRAGDAPVHPGTAGARPPSPAVGTPPSTVTPAHAVPPFSPDASKAEKAERMKALRETPEAQRILAGHKDSERVDKFLRTMKGDAEESLKAVEKLIGASRATPNQAMRIMELAEDSGTVADVLFLINSGRLQHADDFYEWMKQMAQNYGGKKAKPAKRRPGMRHELMFAAEMAREGRDVSVGGFRAADEAQDAARASTANDVKNADAGPGGNSANQSHDAADLAAEGDVVVYGPHGAEAAYQVKRVEGDSVGAVTRNAHEAITQMHGDNELIPDGVKRIAHITIQSDSNKLFHASRAELEHQLRGRIAELKPGETMVVVNGSGEHTFTSPRVQ